MELAALLAKNFIQRRDVIAVQQSNGAYMPERRPFKMNDLRDHLEGRVSLGHYLVDPGGKTRVAAFDLDFIKDPVVVEGETLIPRDIWRTEHLLTPDLTRQIQLLATGLAIRLNKWTGSHVAISFSGNKGLHVYALPGEPIEAGDAMLALRATLEYFGWEPSRGNNFYRDPEGRFPFVEIETFPKQARIGDDPDSLGNLMRLPLGINRKTKQRTFFIRSGPPPTELTEWDPEAALSGEVLPWVEL